MTTILLGAASAAIWVYLIALRGGFWRIRAEPAPVSPPPRRVTAVIPARDEAAVIGRAVASLLAQRLSRPVRMSSSLTITAGRHAEIALYRRRASRRPDRLTSTRASRFPPGWTGKLWALATASERARARQPDYLLLTDADIVHAPDNFPARRAGRRRAATTWFR